MATTTANTRIAASSPSRDWTAVLPMVLLPGIVIAVVPRSWPRWLFMWLLAAGIYAACKWLTWYSTPPSRAPWYRHLAYLFLWPGMDASAFLRSGPLGQADRPT